MKLNKAWCNTFEQNVSFKGKYYSVSELIDMAKDIETQEATIDAFAMDYGAPCNDTLISFAQHMKQVNEADLKHPIILSPCGVIVDGRHRLIKSLVEGKPTIKFKRLEEMPAPAGEVKESE